VARGDRSTGGPWRWRGVLGAVGLLVLLAALVPPLRARAVAVTATAGALDLPVPRPLAGDVERGETTLAGTVVDRYRRPGSSDPTIVLVPGATPEGRDDERAVRLARALARSGRTVVVPELEVYEPTLTPADVERIAGVVAVAADEAPVTLVGISFGGSLALRALGDHPELAERVSLAAVFGAYADLVGVLQGAATGVVLVDGEAVPWEPAQEAEDILRDELVGALPDDLAAAAEAGLAGDRPIDELPPGARAAVDLLQHDDPARTADIVAALPAELRERLAAVSPVHVADRIRVPVRILHARDDPAVPFAEGRRLAGVLPDVRFLAIEGFEHVDLALDSPRAVVTAGRALGGVWRVVGAVLSAGEPWRPASLR
jgi:pimeloyl-ACP methyl ester carboxylesterase